MVIAVHLYHIVAFTTLKLDDIWHHLLFVPVIGGSGEDTLNKHRDLKAMSCDRSVSALGAAAAVPRVFHFRFSWRSRLCKFNTDAAWHHDQAH